MLYVVATPIGNFADITYRAVEILSNVDVILAEDTRHSRKLLQHLGVNTKLESLHMHNEHNRLPALLERLQNGVSMAIISDGGTPLICDPGYGLIQAAHKLSLSVCPVPGASAVIAALSAAGIAAVPFYFHGFLPSRQLERQACLKHWQQAEYTAVCYEAPHRLEACLRDIAKVLGGDRVVCLAREITKKFEKFLTGPVDYVLAEWQQQGAYGGECVVCISPVKPEKVKEIDLKTEELLKHCLALSLSVKDTAELMHKLTGHPKKVLYNACLAIKNS